MPITAAIPATMTNPQFDQTGGKKVFHSGGQMCWLKV